MACAQRCRADVPPRGLSGTLASAALLSIPGGSTFEVDVRLLQFVAMVLTALALVPGGAHPVRPAEQDRPERKRLLYYPERLSQLGAARDRFDWSCNCERCACVVRTRTARALDLRADRRGSVLSRRL